jgi:2-polyprenyl-6-methoxyphenol hydroxylase-like FAD-dependent oxidoreductase
MAKDSAIDTLVVGAGPVGMTVACELRRHGVACRIVERSAARTDKSKALVLWSRSLELLHAMGGVEAFLATGMEAHGASLYGEGRRLVHFSFSGVDSLYRLPLMIPQSETERLLEERLAELGARPERRVELVAIADGDGDEGVGATLRHPDGSEERVRCGWLVGCDGAHSTVRHLLDVPYSGDAEPNDWLLADVHLQGPVAADEVTVHFHPAGILVFFPISPGRFRVIADVGLARGVEHPPDPTLDQVQRILDERGPGGIVAEDSVWLSGFRIHERKAATYRPARRVFLAGDAAHIHSPAGGQGMNTGMQDAFNLAWKLALVHRGRARPEPLLGSYDTERGAVGEAVLRNATLMTRIGTLHRPLAQHVRNRVYEFIGGLSAVQSHLAQVLSEVAIRYPDSPLSGEARGPGAHGWLLGGGVAPGSRMPDVELLDASSRARMRLLDLLREPAHRLLLLHGAAGMDDGPSSEELERRIAAAAAPFGDAILFSPVRCDRAGGMPLTAGLLDPGDGLHRALGAGLPTVVLVRPDGYVGFRGQPADPEPLARHLDGYLVRSDGRRGSSGR